MEYAAVLLSLFGASLAGLFGKKIGNKGTSFIVTAFIFIAALCSMDIFLVVAMKGNVKIFDLFTWIDSEYLQIKFSIYLDQLSSLMLVIINIISFAAHLYSIGTMRNNKNLYAFMGALSLLTFAMIIFVVSSNFVQMFLGLELVSIATYLLVKLSDKKDKSSNADIRSFVVNRIGDFAILLAIIVTYVAFNSLDFSSIFLSHYNLAISTLLEKKEMYVSLFNHDFHAISLICLLLFIGAMCRSAQIGFHIWLDDVSESATPAGLFINSAASVATGVFIIARFSPLYELSHGILEIVSIIGLLSAFIGAAIAITQNDIKKILTYSTISQIGYIFIALGASAYGAAMFHLVTHSFIKALLFAGAGYVVYVLDGRQDIKKMGALSNYLPTTCAFMWIGALSVSGIPYFAGYYSKTAIFGSIDCVYFWVGLIVSFMTAIYSWRFVFLIFHGKPHESRALLENINEKSFVINFSMCVLLLGTIFSGWWFYDIFMGIDAEGFWADSLVVNEASANIIGNFVRYAPIVATLLGALASYVSHVGNPKLHEKVSEKFGLIHKLFYNKLYVDRIYDILLVQPILYMANKFSREIDFKLIDGFSNKIVPYFVNKMPNMFYKNNIYAHIFAVAVGLLTFIAAFLIMGGK